MTTYKSNRQTISLFILFIIISTGCSKNWLEAKGDAKLTVPTTLKDFQALLDDGQKMNFSDMDYGEIASDDHYVTDVNYTNAISDARKDAYTWSKTLYYTSGAGSDWQTSHFRLLYCNTVLDGISKFVPQNEQEKTEADNIKGQAYFHRARIFFHLSQLYTPPINNENKNSELGLLLRVNVDITTPSKRSSIKNTYDQIINDLNSAETLLPDRPKILTRGSKSSVYALLARTYLSLQDYENALNYANKSLSIYSKLLDYNNVSLTAGFIGLYNDEVLLHCTLGTTSLISKSNCLFDSTFYKLYDINDLRRKVYFLDNKSGAFTFQGSYNNTSKLFSGLATDEMYLIKAECLARKGDMEESMNLLNTLLQKRWSKSVEFKKKIVASADEALSLILLERRKSLILRGLRWMDLRRLNQDSKYKITINKKVNGKTYTLEPNSFKYAFPIPDDVIQQTGVQQNPGWTN